MQCFQGKSVYKGIAMGPVVVLKKNDYQVKRTRIEDAEAEAARVDVALKASQEQLQKLYDKAVKEVGEASAAIFEVHQMMLEDEDYLEAIQNMIRTEQVNAEYAVAVTGDNFAEMFASMDDDYMKARSADIKDISERLVRNLSGQGDVDLSSIEPSVIVADDLSPSETVQMDKDKILAFVTVHGSTNSHTAILARMMNIPALIGVNMNLEELQTGMTAVVDGFGGKVTFEPDEELKAQTEARMQEEEEKLKLLQELKGKENITLDGRKINIYANIGRVGDIGYVMENDAGGIGLFRSCLLYTSNMKKEGLSMNKEPFLQVSKRRNKAGWQERLLIRFIALILALIVCGAVIVALVKMNPVDVYKAIWDGAMGSERRIWQTIRDTMVLLCIAIGLAPAFKMKFWNIGAEGQILIGGACSAAVLIYEGDKMSPVVLLIVMFVASALGGMIWGMIPAVFKAYWNTNETLFTLMLNYVAMQVVTYCIVFWENPKGSNTVGIINQTTQTGWLPELFGQKYGWNVLIVMILTVGMFIYLKYCKQGYEIAVVGESENTAKYAGIHVKKVIIRTMAISGAICGIAGFVIVSGASHTISTATAGGRGFTAIIVAWLSKFNTFIMVAVSFGIVFMNQGAVQIATQYGLNENASDVILGIILFFLIGAEFFINYRVKRAKK